jgi:hypothetical protein
MRKSGKGLRFEKIQEMRDESPTLRILYLAKILTGPERAREIPFEFAICGGMREIEQSPINLREDMAKRSEEFG